MTRALSRPGAADSAPSVPAASTAFRDVLVISAEVPIPVISAALAAIAGRALRVLNLAPAPSLEHRRPSARGATQAQTGLVVNESEAAAVLGRTVAGLADGQPPRPIWSVACGRAQRRGHRGRGRAPPTAARSSRRCPGRRDAPGQDDARPAADAPPGTGRPPGRRRPPRRHRGPGFQGHRHRHRGGGRHLRRRPRRSPSRPTFPPVDAVSAAAAVGAPWRGRQAPHPVGHAAPGRDVLAATRPPLAVQQR